MNNSNGFSILAVLASLVAAAVGAAAWALLAIYGNLEHGMLAWAVGGLVGFATLKGGGRGQVMAVTAAVVSLLAIFGGKFAATKSFVEQGISQENYEWTRDDMAADSAAVIALGDNPTDAQLATVMVERDYVEGGVEDISPERLAWFRDERAPELRDFQVSEFTYERWAEVQRAGIELEVAEAGGYLGLIKEDLNLFDLLFVFLGVSTAFGMVSRADDEDGESLAEN